MMINGECKLGEVWKDHFDWSSTVIIDARYSVIRLIKSYILDNKLSDDTKSMNTLWVKSFQNNSIYINILNGERKDEPVPPGTQDQKYCFLTQTKKWPVIAKTG